MASIVDNIDMIRKRDRRRSLSLAMAAGIVKFCDMVHLAEPRGRDPDYFADLSSLDAHKCPRIDFLSKEHTNTPPGG